MSSSVESRILTMKIENSSFQRGVGTILTSLSKLQTAISGLKPTTAFADISKGAAKTDLTPLGTQIEGINAKFLAMATIGVTAISNLVNRAVDAGFQLANSLTLGPISSGLDEYETNLNSIQTILANTDGENLRDVNNALDQLNTYSDKTIYNFAEMARNIGMFTAAGVDLDTSVGAIKGIANLAAVSGSSSQQASTAMYQLSQALSTGTVKLMDWNSVVNAGMGGKVFQEALKTTARVQGVAIDDIIEANGSFRDSLQEGWLTADILNETLMQFAGELNEKQLENRGYSKQQIADIIKMGKEATDAATKVKTMSQLINTLQETVGSGWAMTWRLIFGDFKQAKEMWTAVNDEIGGILGAMADRRNKMLKEWQKEGGRDAALEAINHAWHAILRVLGPVARAWRDVFPRMTGKQLADITKAIENFTEHLILSRPVMHDIRNTFKGLFDILDIGFEIFKGLVKWFVTGLGLILGGLNPAAAGVLDLTGGFGKMIDSVHDFLVEGGKISGFFDAIIEGREKAFGPLLHIIGVLIGAAFRILAKPFGWFLDAMGAIEPYIDVVERLVNSFEDMVDVGLNKVLDWISGFAPEFEAMGRAISNFMEKGIDKVVEFFKSLRPYADDVGEIANRFADWSKSKAVAFIEKVLAAFEAIKPILKDIGNLIADAFGSLAGAAGNIGSGIAGAVGGLAGGIDLSGLFDFGNVGDAASSQVSKIQSSLGDTEKYIDGARSAWDVLLDGMYAVWDFLEPVREKVEQVFGIIGDAFSKAFDGANTAGEYAQAAWDGLGNAISAVGDFLAPVPGLIGDMFSHLGELVGNLISNLGTEDMFAAINTGFLAFFIIQMSRFFGNLGGVMKSAGQMFEDFGKSGTGAIDQLTANLKTMQTAVKADMILTIALALGVLALSLWVLSKIPAKELGISLAAIAALLAMLVGSMKLLTMGEGLDGKKAAALAVMAGSMVLMALAITTMAGAIALLGHMKPATIWKGLAAVTGILLVMAGAAALLNFSGGSTAMLIAAAAILVLSFALVTFAGTLKLYEKMDFGTIVEGLGKLGLVLVVLGLAMAAMSGGLVGAIAIGVLAVSLAILVPVLLALSKMDLKTMAIVVGALAVAFLVLGGVGAVIGLPLLVLGLAVTALGVGLFLAGAGLALFGAGLATLVGLGAAAAGVLTAMIMSIVDMLPYIFEKLGEAIGVLARVVKENAPAVGKAMQAVMEQLFNAIRKSTPEFGRMMVALIRQTLETTRKTFPDWVRTGYEMVHAILDGLNDNIDSLVEKGVEISVKFMKGIERNADELANAGANMVEAIVIAIGEEFFDRVGQVWGWFFSLGGTIIRAIVSAVQNGLETIRDTIENMAHAAWEAATNAIRPGSESRVYRELGETIPAGMAAGIESGASSAERSSRELADRTVRAFRDTLGLVAEGIGSDLDTTPRITPVLDLSDLRRNAGQIGDILGSDHAIGGAAYRRAAEIFADRAEAESRLREEKPRVTEFKYEQTIISPRPIDTVTTYRNTQSLLAMKEAEIKR